MASVDTINAINTMNAIGVAIGVVKCNRCDTYNTTQTMVQTKRRRRLNEGEDAGRIGYKTRCHNCE